MTRQQKVLIVVLAVCVIGGIRAVFEDNAAQQALGVLAALFGTIAIVQMVRGANKAPRDRNAS
ncbi:hypothetical protein ACOACO_15910 [Nocardioides sp. CPCC 205120]|uniref:hypothetical protein n=1 Tax=Nocardioides sp. CPCC 205120 TaxID=3406462 RepID=UPI003B4FFDF3